jgi:hypothetical protein
MLLQGIARHLRRQRSEPAGKKIVLFIAHIVLVVLEARLCISFWQDTGKIVVARSSFFSLRRLVHHVL